MVFIALPAWTFLFIMCLLNQNLISSDALFLGFSVVTAAFIISWQLYFVAYCKRKDNKKDECSDVNEESR